MKVYYYSDNVVEVLQGAPSEIVEVIIDPQV